MRSSAWTIMGYGGGQAIRLASNLILTRILFPEAFGLMALVTVFIMGLVMFSDVGIGPSILQNKRGDDPEFLNTAWTIQVIRGVVLWLGTCAIAIPAASFYNEPMLAQLLPVAGLSLLVAGFNPTRIETAARHLLIGRLTLIDLSAQTIGIIAMGILAWIFESIWALVAGTVITALAKLVLTSLFLPGEKNRFRWEGSAAHELIHFGKWIFLSTICGFLIGQGDRAILGKYLSMYLLGIYNIGYFLASFPLLLGSAVMGRLMIPLYRERSPSASRENFLRLRKMRFAMTGGLLSLVMLMAFFGPVLIDFLYDDRYAAAGGIVVLIACVQITTVIGMTYDQSALAVGDSRNFFFFTALRATVQTVFFLVGAEIGGMTGALIGQGLAAITVYPFLIRLARRHGAWDALHDAVFFGGGYLLGALALWVNQDRIMHLAQLVAP
jgi:O-antigen/teichoic acid export membrane protein